MSCFMGYNPLVAKEVKITTWIKEFDGDSPVYPSFPNEGDCFVVFATDEDALTHNALSKKTYTNGEWADAEGGGGGMAIPTVTLDVKNMTYTCDVGYDGWYSLLENSIYEDEGDKTHPVWCLETGNIHGTFAVSYLFPDVDGIFASLNEGYGLIFHNDGTIEKSE